jgi:RHS repeat-associated protein
MAWDYKDQLKQVDLGGGGTAYYVYDASGERVRKVIVKTGGIVEQRIYLGGYEIYRKTISGTLDFERETLRISDDRKAIVDIETKTVENGTVISSPVSNIRYQYDNHLGSASLELDATAAIISYEEYHPFGTTSYRSGRIETEVSLKRYKYVDKERDEETGLYYYGARYYAGWICRFVSVDPLAEKYSFQSPYAYAVNNPIRFTDFFGMCPDDIVKTKSWISNVTIDDKTGITTVKETTIKTGPTSTLLKDNDDGTITKTETTKSNIVQSTEINSDGEIVSNKATSYTREKVTVTNQTQDGDFISGYGEDKPISKRTPVEGGFVGNKTEAIALGVIYDSKIHERLMHDLINAIGGQKVTHPAGPGVKPNESGSSYPHRAGGKYTRGDSMLMFREFYEGSKLDSTSKDFKMIYK